MELLEISHNKDVGDILCVVELKGKSDNVRQIVAVSHLKAF